MPFSSAYANARKHDGVDLPQGAAPKHAIEMSTEDRRRMLLTTSSYAAEEKAEESHRRKSAGTFGRGRSPFGALEMRKQRYAAARRQADESFMTPATLLKIVRAKLQERVNCHAEQAIKLKLIFQQFDADDSGCLDETEFRQGLEMLNVQLSDTQTTALFAAFDSDIGGTIDYAEFASLAMLPNPRAGTAVFPKPITLRTCRLAAGKRNKQLDASGVKEEHKDFGNGW